MALATLRLQPSRRALRLGAAVALGIALSSRSNFVFVVPLLAVAIAREDGVKEALRLAGAALAAFIVVTVPFYLADPDGFTPRRTAGKLSEFSDVLPHAEYVTVGLAFAVTVALCFSRMTRSGIELSRNMAVVQAVLVGMPVLLSSIRAGKPDFSFLVAGYGLPIAFFAIVGAWPLLADASRPRTFTPLEGSGGAPAAP